MRFAFKISAVLWILLQLGGITCSQAQSVKESYNQTRNLYDLAVYQWYDLYAEGVMTKAPLAGKLLDSARILMERKMDDKAGKIIRQAEALLKHRDKSVLKRYLPRPANKETAPRAPSEGRLILDLDCLIWDKQFAEYSGTFTGSLNGKPISKGNFLLEHTQMNENQ